MKYLVDVNGHRHEVVAGPSAMELSGGEVATELLWLFGGAEGIWRVGGRQYRALVAPAADSAGRIRRGYYTIWLDGHRFEVAALDERSRAIEALAAKMTPHRSVANVHAPMPGMIVKVQVAVGDSVQAGQSLIVMEAMKMENELRARAAGIVRQIHVGAGVPVEKGALLVEFHDP